MLKSVQSATPFSPASKSWLIRADVLTVSIKDSVCPNNKHIKKVHLKNTVDLSKIDGVFSFSPSNDNNCQSAIISLIDRF